MRNDISRCGFIALVGAPNVGKSSILNALVGHKVGIVSAKPNTTRVVVRGITAYDSGQFVFVDTPGLNRSQSALERTLVQQAHAGAAEADIVALVIDATRGFDARANDIIDRIKKSKQTFVLIINKIDQLKPRTKVAGLLEEAQKMDCFTSVLIVSATTGNGLKDVLPTLAKLLPPSPWLFPPDMQTDIPTPVRLAEITREKAMQLLQDEVPYGIAVKTVAMDETAVPMKVNQTLMVAKEAHKAIVIGKKGDMLSRIGTAARKEMQDILGKGVRLEIQVETAAGWDERMELLREMGVLHA